MRRALFLIWLVFLPAPVRAGEPRAASPGEFKVQVEVFGIRKEPVRRGELLARKGRAYWILSDSNEVVVYEPNAGQIELLDLEDMERTDLPLKTLAGAVDRWRDIRVRAAAKLEQTGGRANLLAAETGRGLLQPKFAATFEATSNRLKLTSTSVDVDAIGEPDTDASRRTFETSALAVILELETIRDPRALPPFAALQGLRELTTSHTLRPQEITCIYRHGGRARTIRWTYRMVTELTERERASIAKIDVARERARFLRFNDYNAADEP